MGIWKKKPVTLQQFMKGLVFKTLYGSTVIRPIGVQIVDGAEITLNH